MSCCQGELKHLEVREACSKWEPWNKTTILLYNSFLDESNPHSGNGLGGGGGGHGHLSNHGHSHHQLPSHMPHPLPHSSSAPSPLGPPPGPTTSWLFSSPHAPPQPPQTLFQVIFCPIRPDILNSHSGVTIWQKGVIFINQFNFKFNFILNKILEGTWCLVNINR